MWSPAAACSTPTCGWSCLSPDPPVCVNIAFVLQGKQAGVGLMGCMAPRYVRVHTCACTGPCVLNSIIEVAVPMMARATERLQRRPQGAGLRFWATPTVRTDALVTAASIPSGCPSASAPSPSRGEASCSPSLYTHLLWVLLPQCAVCSCPGTFRLVSLESGVSFVHPTLRGTRGFPSVTHPSLSPRGTDPPIAPM